MNFPCCRFTFSVARTFTEVVADTLSLITLVMPRVMQLVAAEEGEAVRVISRHDCEKGDKYAVRTCQDY